MVRDSQITRRLCTLAAGQPAPGFFRLSVGFFPSTFSQKGESQLDDPLRGSLLKFSKDRGMFRQTTAVELIQSRFTANVPATWSRTFPASLCEASVT